MNSEDPDADAHVASALSDISNHWENRRRPRVTILEAGVNGSSISLASSHEVRCVQWASIDFRLTVALHPPIPKDIGIPIVGRSGVNGPYFRLSLLSQDGRNVVAQTDEDEDTCVFEQDCHKVLCRWLYCLHLAKKADTVHQIRNPNQDKGDRFGSGLVNSFSRSFLREPESDTFRGHFYVRECC